jgi:dephospho-CoA kinase
MTLLGITGGVGMGKSTSASLLQQRGVPVVDTDDLARQVVEPGQPALKEIEANFGGHVIGPDGGLRRDELAKVVFAEDAGRRRLEDILHPRIRELWRTQVAGWRAENKPLGAVIIPLLFETAAEKEFDAIICVACSSRSQMERLRQRGWTEDQSTQRIAAQWPTQKKMDLAGFVIWTEPAVAAHAAQLDRILVRWRK